jgi:hypothetical protein
LNQCPAYAYTPASTDAAYSYSTCAALAHRFDAEIGAVCASSLEIFITKTKNFVRLVRFEPRTTFSIP